MNRKKFEKGTLERWSKTVHKIISHTEHTYTLDNGTPYKYYELQKVNQVQKQERAMTEPTRERMRKEKTSQRRLNREGLDKRMMID